MSFERLTDAGPKGGKAAFKESPSETMVKPQGDSLKPRSRQEWHSCEARIRKRIAAWSERLRDDRAVGFTDC